MEQEFSVHHGQILKKNNEMFGEREKTSYFNPFQSQCITLVIYMDCYHEMGKVSFKKII